MTSPPRDVLAPLVAKGLSDSIIAERFRVSARSVLRWRIRYQLASQWTPPSREHTTRCPCTDCAAERALAGRLFRHRSQAALPYSPNAYAPWTDREDQVLNQLGPLAASRVLGRTYYACVNRRTKHNQQRRATSR